MLNNWLSVLHRTPATLAKIGARTLVVGEKDILWDALNGSNALIEAL
jgi:hypothetical protein